MATNQPNQPRPWLRLTSLAGRTNIPTPAPAPAPFPRPASRPQQPQAAPAPPPPDAPRAVVARPALIRPTVRPPADAPAAQEAQPIKPRPQVGIQLAPPPTSPVKPPPTNGDVKAITTPTSPLKQPVPTNGASKATSPPKPAAATGRPPATVKATSPTTAALSRSLKPAAESPPHSPPRKTTAAPPSPLTLPPPQLKSQEKPEPLIPMDAEQKTVLFQKTVVGKPNNSHLDEATTMQHAEKKEKAHHKKPSEETGVRVITIAGENRGASMELMKSRRERRFEGHPHHFQKKSNGKSLSDAGSEHQSYSSSEEAKQYKTGKAAAPNNAYMNSNVQGINNSIVYNSSYTHHDPGVHVAFSKKPSGSGGGFFEKDHSNLE